MTVEIDPSSPRRRAGSPEPPGAGSWCGAALAGAVTFWLANFAISRTPVAAQYRAALSIDYVPMLIEAAVGGALIAIFIASLLARHPTRVPGAGPVRKALLLSVAALVLLTVIVEVPAKVGSGLPDSGHWFLVAAAFNVIRLLAMGAVIGTIFRRRGAL